jgi:hypothetical protein
MQVQKSHGVSDSGVGVVGGRGIGEAWERGRGARDRQSREEEIYES